MWFQAGGAHSLPARHLSSYSSQPLFPPPPVIQTPDDNETSIINSNQLAAANRPSSSFFQYQQCGLPSASAGPRLQTLMSNRLGTPLELSYSMEAKSTLDLRERIRFEIRNRSNSLNSGSRALMNPFSATTTNNPFGNRTLKNHTVAPPSIGPKAPRRSRMYRM